MSAISCDGVACCPHPDESQRVLNRDGVLCVVCVECNTEIGPADTKEHQLTHNVAAPCGDDIPNRWGGPL